MRPVPPNTAFFVAVVSSPLVALVVYAAHMPQILISGTLFLSAVFAFGVGILGLINRGDRKTTILSALLILYSVPLALFAFAGCAFGARAPYVD